MIHDQSLVDKLSALATERFEGEVFRATGISADALAFSVKAADGHRLRATARMCRFSTPAWNETGHWPKSSRT
jgi:hypothetical protein